MRAWTFLIVLIGATLLAAQDQQPEKTYRVRKGDSLISIARDQIGAAEQAGVAIYAPLLASDRRVVRWAR